jgi:hypothetical protein
MGTYGIFLMMMVMMMMVIDDDDDEWWGFNTIKCYTAFALYSFTVYQTRLLLASPCGWSLKPLKSLIWGFP